MRWLVVLVVAYALVACSGRDQGPPADRAFYYWRTTFKLSGAERATLTDVGITKLYVRVFDVEWDGITHAPRMIGRLSATERAPAGIEVVPVVFLRADVFTKLDAKSGAAFAKTMWDEAKRRASLIGEAPRELQLDCDWTDATRDRFFGWMRDVKRESGVKLSATIRLHQVKYREKTGVPPVERGMLMFYNMGSFSAGTGDRAIFDATAADKYLARIADYPLPLDVALPIWSWTVHVRDGRVIDLLQATDPDQLGTHDFLIPGGLDRYVATRTSFLNGALIREGDVLKIERMSPGDTQAAADLLVPKLASWQAGAAARSVALFDLSERNLSRHGKDTLDTLYRSVR